MTRRWKTLFNTLQTDITLWQQDNLKDDSSLDILFISIDRINTAHQNILY